MEIAKVEHTQIARPLHVLVPLIRDDLSKAKDAGKPYYRAAGEKLHEAKRSGNMSISELVKWSQRNFNVGRSQLLLYMKYASATSHLSSQETPSLHKFRVSQGTKQTVYPHAWHEPVKEAIGKVNISALKQDAMAKQEERALQRKLALSLIDIGYKALAAKLHPDKGGSREAMTRLNRVRDLLRGAVT